MTGSVVVALGGGHGLAASLRALRLLTDQITAVVTVADDGGSSGRLRDEFGVLPPGDLRMALAALCDDTEWGHQWRDLLQHRFAGGGPLGGHAVGNLLIVSLWDLLGDTVGGLDLVGRLLNAHGRVLPMAAVPLNIEANVLGADPQESFEITTVQGQAAVATTGGRVLSVRLNPQAPPACDEAVAAIVAQDAEAVSLNEACSGDAADIAASLLDGLLYGSGDAVFGINPASDNVPQVVRLLGLLDEIIQRYAIPAQSCVLTHVTNTLQAIERGAPVDLVFQSIGGTEASNRSFGVSLALLGEARSAALSLQRGTLGDNVMYFETGQGSALSAQAHHGLDQQTCEARAYAVARQFKPLLVNSVVGFIGPEYLYDGKQIIRAGLEDHFCGKLLGLPMGCDICYTNHAEADQNDMDVLLTLLAVAGCTFVMGVPGSDDIMLNYQSTSFHDVLYARRVLGLRPAPEFEAWLEKMQIVVPGEGDGPPQLARQIPPAFRDALLRLSRSASAP